MQIVTSKMLIIKCDLPVGYALFDVSDTSVDVNLVKLDTLKVIRNEE